MNTVGVAGRLGGATRCVVSVSMLTEGWDARTVTHILGVRAFGTQLLCEQVVGRALRRQSLRPERREPVQRRVCGRARHPVRLHRRAGGGQAPQAAGNGSGSGRHPGPGCDARSGSRACKATASSCPKNTSTRSSDRDSTLVLTPKVVGPSITHNAGIIGEGVDLNLVHRRDLRPFLAGVPPHQDPAGKTLARPQRGSEAAPVRPAQTGHPPLAGPSPDLQGRHLPCPAHVPGTGRPGLHPHHARHRGAPPRRASGHRGARPLQSDRLDHACQLHHLQADPLANRPAPLPRELGGVRQRLGGRVLPLHRIAAGGPRLRQEPRPGAGSPLPLRLRSAHLPPRLHRVGRRRPRQRRPAPPRGWRSRATAARTPRTRRTPWIPTGSRASTAPPPSAAGPSPNSPTCIPCRTTSRPRSGHKRKRAPASRQKEPCERHERNCRSAAGNQDRPAQLQEHRRL